MFVTYLIDNDGNSLATDNDVDAPQVFRFEKIREVKMFLLSNLGRMQYRANEDCDVRRKKAVTFKVVEGGRDVTEEFKIILSNR